MNSLSSSEPADLQSSATEQSLREQIAKIQETNRMLADFAALVSHDLQSGLRGVASFSALLRVVPAIEADPQTFALLNSIQAYARKIKCLTEESRIPWNDVGPTVEDTPA